MRHYETNAITFRYTNKKYRTIYFTADNNPIKHLMTPSQEELKWSI